MQLSGRWKLGFGLAIITTILWGVLPIALKAMLSAMGPNTITWYRFLVAAGLLGLHLVLKRTVPRLNKISKKTLTVLLVAIFCLSGNYILYLLGLNLISAEAAQMVIQLAPMFLLIGGLIFFKEPFANTQWIGFFLLTGGLILFFNHRLDQLTDLNGTYFIGVLLIVASAVVWATYALAQKKLLADFSSEQILWMIYTASVVILFPLTDLPQIFQLTKLQFGILLFCSLNTLVAYGSFGEALAHWEASRVSAVIAVAPLITLTSIWIMDHLVPGFIETEKLNTLSIVGSALIILGSMLAALGKRNRKKESAEPTVIPE